MNRVSVRYELLAFDDFRRFECFLVGDQTAILQPHDEIIHLFGDSRLEHTALVSDVGNDLLTLETRDIAGDGSVLSGKTVFVCVSELG